MVLAKGPSGVADLSFSHLKAQLLLRSLSQLAGLGSLPCEPPHRAARNRTTYIPQTGTSGRKRRPGCTEATVFYNLTSQVTFHYLLLDEQPRGAVGGGTTQNNTWRRAAGAALEWGDGPLQGGCSPLTPWLQVNALPIAGLPKRSKHDSGPLSRAASFGLVSVGPCAIRWSLYIFQRSASALP